MNKAPYESNDMCAAVAWSQATKAKYAEGYKLPAYRMFREDPNTDYVSYEGFCQLMEKLYGLK